MNKSFQEWWNNHFFYTEYPYRQLYNIYIKLPAKHADLDYIEALGRWLIIGEDDLSFIAENIKADPLLKESNRLINPSGLSKWIKERTAKLMEEAGMTAGRESQRELEEESRTGIADSREIRRAKQMVDFDRSVKELLRKNPIQAILYAYTSGPLFYNTGRREDDLGTFFLLAVSEHLREVGGKPQFVLSGRLLRALRDDQRSVSASAIRLNTMVRVAKFRKSDPHWEIFLRALKNSYKRYKKSQQPSQAGPKMNTIICRSIIKRLSQELPAGSQINFNSLVDIFNRIRNDFLPDTSEVKLSDLINPARSLLEKNQNDK